MSGMPGALGGGRCCLASMHGLCAGVSDRGWDSHFASWSSDEAQREPDWARLRLTCAAGGRTDLRASRRSPPPPGLRAPEWRASLSTKGRLAGVWILALCRRCSVYRSLFSVYGDHVFARFRYDTVTVSIRSMALPRVGCRRVWRDVRLLPMKSQACVVCRSGSDGQHLPAIKESADGGRIEGGKILDERTRQSAERIAGISERFVAGGGCGLRISCGSRLRRQPATMRQAVSTMDAFTGSTNAVQAMDAMQAALEAVAYVM